MIRLFHKPDPDAVLSESPAEELAQRRRESRWVWVDLEAPTEADIDYVAAEFDLDDLVVRELKERTHFPKADDLGDYVFVVLHGVTREKDRLATAEVDFLLGEDYLVSIHRSQFPAVDFVIENGLRAPTFSSGGPDEMFARLAEAQGRRYLPLLDELEHRIEALEDRALYADPSVIADVQALRRDALILRRVIGPQREVLLELSREGVNPIGRRGARRFSGIYDQHYRIVESLDASRGMLASVLDTYRSSVAEKMNEVMKVLTVYAAILLPLSLLAGLYGMNFVNIPELQWQWGYFILVGIMATVAVGQWIYFARRGFIGGPSLRKTLKVPTAIGRGLAHLALTPVRVIETIIDMAENEQGRESDQT